MNKQDYLSLVEDLNGHNYHYYTLDKPIISDKEYDALYDKLLKIEKENPEWITLDSPSHKIGGEILSEFQKKEHTTQLYSLDKAQTYDELKKFFDDISKTIGKKDIKFTVELKFDGLTSIIKYQNGLLNEGRTRGNGKIGEVITPQIKTIKSVPLKLKNQNTFEIQGETYMPKDIFEKLNANLEKEYRTKRNIHGELTNIQKEELKELKFKNSRNAAGGSLRNLDPKVTSERDLDLFVYNIPYFENMDFQTQTEMMEFLKEQGFKTNPYFHTIKSVEEAITLIEDMVHKRPSLNYDIDGMVFKVDNIHYRDILGFTSKFPKWAIAWKFEAEQAETKLIDVLIETGRTGKVTPIGILQPVEIAGATISKVTLNNFEWIEEKGLKKALGTNVIVRRSNDVIPEILFAPDGDKGEEIKAPEKCPSCNSILEKDGVHLFCRGTNCPSQSIGKIVHYTSREAMDIDTFSIKTAEQLWDNGLIKNISDIYKLKYDDLINLERFGKRKADKLLEAIEKSKEKPLEAFLYGLGIPMAGKGTIERLLRYYNDIEGISNLTINQLSEIEDIGEIVASNIYNFFRDGSNLNMLSELRKLGVKMEHIKKESLSDNFENLVFVVTGTMPSGKKRKDIEDMIQKNGGKISKSVGPKTDFLIAGEDAGSKLEKAKKIEEKLEKKIIISEEEFYNML